MEGTYTLYRLEGIDVFLESNFFQSPISTFDILGDDCLEIRHLVEIL